MSNLVIFLGPPGAGKGTQAATIAKEKNLAHISTGDMLREHVNNKTQLGKIAKTLLDEGKLVPDSLVIEMLQERLLSKDCVNGAWDSVFIRDTNLGFAIRQKVIN